MIKANHSLTEGSEPLTMLPQIFPIGLAETFVQLLDRKTKTKGKLSAMIRNICKPSDTLKTQLKGTLTAH